MYDVIIKNGTIVDGSGNNQYRADIGIKGEYIVKIGLIDDRCPKVIEADGKTITPGFIDMHSHADTVILGYPKMESMLHQGITTFVGCQCGHSIAPVGEWWEGSQALYHLNDRASDKLVPDMYNMDYYAPTEKIVPMVEEEFGFTPTWKTMGAFMDEVDHRGISGNIIMLAGYNTLRLNACEKDYATIPNKEQKNKLKSQINECMEAGAFGMSTGLDYKPGVFCKTDELVEMTKELKRYDGIYFTHWRKTGLRAGTPKKQKKIDGIIEAMEIGVKNDIQVQISHLSHGFDIFPSRDDYMHVAIAERTLQFIDDFANKGLNVNFDVIPNITAGTSIMSDLAAFFRPWFIKTNGLKNFIKNIAHADYRDEIKTVIEAGKYFTLNPIAVPDWDEWMIIIDSARKEYINQSIKCVAESRNMSSLDLLFYLLIEEPHIKVFMASHSMNIHGVKTYLNHPLAVVGNDTFVYDLESCMHYDPENPRMKPNPNTYCGFIKYLTELGRPRFEDSIKKMTGQSAEILGLTDRGFIREGYRADLVIMNRENLKTNESYIEPRVYPDGIEDVFVNGVMVLENGAHTGALPGGVIRRQDR